MEKYEGIKFKTQKLSETFDMDSRLSELNYWVFIFGELGLAPVHAEGAYGNHSFRLTDDSFIITRTGMKPCLQLNATDYCEVRYDNKEQQFLVKGKYDPSSECFLHSMIYSAFPQINVIMHGHSALFNNHAAQLDIQVTDQEFPYGTMELARSAVQICDPKSSFFIMKNHGFVATGIDIDSTVKKVLNYYGKLLRNLIQQKG